MRDTKGVALSGLIALVVAPGCVPGSGTASDGGEAECIGPPGSPVCMSLTLWPWRLPPEPLAPEAERLAGVAVELVELASTPTVLQAGTTDAVGNVWFQQEPTFYGFARVSALGSKPMNYYWGIPITAAWAGLGRGVPVIDEDDWPALHSLAMQAEDPTSAVIIGKVPTGCCTTLSLDVGGVPIYGTGTMPDPGASMTDEDGVFYVFGVPAGAAVLTATNGSATTMVDLWIYAGESHFVPVYYP